MTNLETELQHLIGLMEPPYRDNWKSFCWAKAVYLSEYNPKEYGELPRLLKEAMLPKPDKDTPTTTTGSE